MSPFPPVFVDALICRDGDTDGNGSLDERLYAVQDANFNVVAVLDTSGAVVERFAYDAFGVFSVLTPAWGSRASSNYGWVYLHQGGRWDADGSVYRFRHREYSPTLGRWFQIDPIPFVDTSNHTLYELNNPLFFVDPNGTKPLSSDELAELLKLHQKLMGVFITSQMLDDHNRWAKLMLRLRHEGVEFKGTKDLENLQKLFELGSLNADRSKLPKPVRGAIQLNCDWLEKAIELAVSGLQKIEDKKYERYVEARKGGATHDEACTFHNPDDPGLCDRYKARYALERYLENMKTKPPSLPRPYPPRPSR